jgi:hypothetical protein
MKKKNLSKRARRERRRIIKAISPSDRVAYRLYVYSCRAIDLISRGIAQGLCPEKLAREGIRALKTSNRHLCTAIGRRKFRNFQVRYLLTKSARC